MILHDGSIPLMRHKGQRTHHTTTVGCFLILALGLAACSSRVEEEDPSLRTSRPSSVQKSANWNTWFEYDGEPAPIALTVGNRYTFVMDLSPFEYARLGTDPAGTAASTAVDPS